MMKKNFYTTKIFKAISTYLEVYGDTVVPLCLAQGFNAMSPIRLTELRLYISKLVDRRVAKFETSSILTESFLIQFRLDKRVINKLLLHEKLNKYFAGYVPSFQYLISHNNSLLKKVIQRNRVENVDVSKDELETSEPQLDHIRSSYIRKYLNIYKFQVFLNNIISVRADYSDKTVAFKPEPIDKEFLFLLKCFNKWLRIPALLVVPHMQTPDFLWNQLLLKSVGRFENENLDYTSTSWWYLLLLDLQKENVCVFIFKKNILFIDKILFILSNK